VLCSYCVLLLLLLLLLQLAVQGGLRISLWWGFLAASASETARGVQSAPKLDVGELSVAKRL